MSPLQQNQPQPQVKINHSLPYFLLVVSVRYLIWSCSYLFYLLSVHLPALATQGGMCLRYSVDSDGFSRNAVVNGWTRQVRHRDLLCEAE